MLKSKQNTLLTTCISLKCAPNKFLEFPFFPPLFPFIYLLTLVFLLIWCLTHLILTNLLDFLFNFHFFYESPKNFLEFFPFLSYNFSHPSITPPPGVKFYLIVRPVFINIKTWHYEFHYTICHHKSFIIYFFHQVIIRVSMFFYFFGYFS